MIKYVHWTKKLQENLAAFYYILFRNIYNKAGVAIWREDGHSY